MEPSSDKNNRARTVLGSLRTLYNHYSGSSLVRAYNCKPIGPYRHVGAATGLVMSGFFTVNALSGAEPLKSAFAAAGVLAVMGVGLQVVAAIEIGLRKTGDKLDRKLSRWKSEP